MERIDEQDIKIENSTNSNEFCEPNNMTREQKQKNSRRKKTFFGLAVLAFGTWWLLRRMDIEILPEWVMTWPMLLIAIGFFNLIANRFRNVGGYILVLIGSVFLAKNVFHIPFTIEPYFWPAVVIAVGLIILFKPHKDYGSRWKKKRHQAKRERFNMNPTDNGGDRLDSLVVMGGISKDVITKNFQGGDITAALAGVDINFGKADMESSAILDCTIVAGGVKLIVPKNWEIQINTTNIMGAVDDKRRNEPLNDMQTKTLTLKGTVVFGGIEITSY